MAVTSKPFVGTFAECLMQAEEGDVLALIQRNLAEVPSDDMCSFDEQYQFAAILVASDDMKVLTRFYRGEPKWIEPLEGTMILSTLLPVAGTTILVDDEYVTLIDQNGKKIPCDSIATCVLLKNKAPDLPDEYQFG